MRSKSNKRLRNINGQPFDTETPNNPEKPCSPYIYQLPNEQLTHSPHHARMLMPVNNGANANVLVQDSLLLEAPPSRVASSHHIPVLQSDYSSHQRCQDTVSTEGECSEKLFWNQQLNVEKHGQTTSGQGMCTNLKMLLTMLANILAMPVVLCNLHTPRVKGPVP